MYADPAISRVKFDREIADFRAAAQAYHRRGIWLIEATFPDVFLVFVAIHAKPYPLVAFGVRMNFDNYDLAPPSVRFVNPLTREPLKKREMQYDFKRLMPFAFPGMPPGGMAEQPMLQGFDDDQPPFLCVQGIREYHEHPGHSGDSWWLYRQTGMGTLAALVNVLAKYGTDAIKGIHIQLSPQITGFMVPQVPQ